MPAFFVPARSSRHRTACFALYRALLRQVPNIHLPDDIATGWGNVNPIKYLIRAGFRRNRADTSPRLVTAALTSGYRLLGLLSSVRDTSSAGHRSVIAFLGERLVRYRRHLADHPRRTPAPLRPRAPPLLSRLPVDEGARPVYVPLTRPLPLSEIRGGVRKVPKLAHTNGVPFLRLGKPQSPALGRALGRRKEEQQGWITLAQQLHESGRPDAAEEDRWEDIVQRQMRQDDETSVADSDAGGLVADERADASTKYTHAVQLSIDRLYEKLNEQREDMVARAAAMMRIVDAEQALAEKEAKERLERQRTRQPDPHSSAPLDG
ncbi:hypothetical protein NKR23_g6212 [Pleurostoma richardsiae]|uniref:Uncharacterized protein n=1 Tax=Pleurostoma richardsiae TaxID=41990 RepID=A0AA38RQB8_9PEZI|nr:hypothetical protein NKR23_g6212 [Pleurostoma richardsiae]